MMLSCALSVVADANTALPPTMTGYLTSENGDIVEITGYLIQNETSLFSCGETGQATYGYTIPTSLLSDDFSDDGWDITGSIYAELTIYYSESYFDGLPHIKLDRVAGYWVFHDTSVQISNMSIEYGCTGFTRQNNAGYVTQTNTRNVNNNFSVSTGFSSYVCDDGVSTIGMTLNMDLRRGSSSNWTSSVSCNL